MTIVLALAVTLSGCAHNASKPTSQAATYQYSCCESGDITPIRQAGEAMTVHWIATAAPPAAAHPATPVTLSATLTGPFSDVAALKTAMASSPRRSPTIVAATLQTTDQSGGAPVSTLKLPTVTLPGFYDITTTVASAGGTESADGVIQIGADTTTS